MRIAEIYETLLITKNMSGISSIAAHISSAKRYHAKFFSTSPSRCEATTRHSLPGWPAPATSYYYLAV
jgi:hypothetical protein